MSRLVQRERRRGTTTIELVVSFSLLATLLGVAVPLTVRHGRILTSARHYRIALDELSNQAEMLAAVDPDEAAASIELLEPSEFAAERLPGVELFANASEPDDAGARRVRVSIVWDEPGRRDNPLALTIWLTPRRTIEAVDADSPATEEQP